MSIIALRNSARSTYETGDEMTAMADKKELALIGHECGHQFTITFTSTMHSGIAGQGPESHRDADDASEPATVTVRSDLSSALRKAAALPLATWFPEEDS